MKTLLKFICWIGLAASIFYLGFTWWTIPIFGFCLISVKLYLGISDLAKENFTMSSYIIFGLYFAVVAIYVFSGDDYLIRAMDSIYSAKYTLNLIIPVMMVLVLGAESSGSYGGSRGRGNQYVNDEVPVSYDNAYGQKRDIIDQLRVENLGDVAAGAKDPNDAW